MNSNKNKFFGFWLFGKSAAGLSGGKKVLFHFWNWLLPILAALGTGMMSLTLAYGRYTQEVFYDYFTHPLIVLLNLLPALLLSLIFYSVFGRSWIAHLAASLIVLGLSTANYFMLLFRDDTLMFLDIMDAATAMGVVGNYNLTIDDRLLPCILYLVFSTVLLALLVRGRQKWPVRVTVGILTLLICVFPLRKTYLSNSIYNHKTQNFDHVKRWSATQTYLSRGFLYPFIHSIGEAFPTAPAGYSADYAKSLLAPYSDADIPEGQKVNVVVVMLEAFSDMSVWDIPGLSEEVYAPYHALEAESVHGTLIDNIFAGGTTNTERCFLTGSGVLENYRKNVNSYVWYFRSQGYSTGGSHPCNNWFYNRRNVNNYLGFEEYYFLEDHYDTVSGGGIAFDNTFFPELTRLCLEDFQNGPSFSYNLTYQGHGPYDLKTLWFGEWVEKLDYTQDSWMIMNNYFGSVKDTSERLSKMVDAFRECDEPVVLVVFGDHKPWFGDANSVYNELGINMDTSTEEGFYNYYSTRWLIWANDEAKEVLHNDFVGEGPTLSSSFLMNYLFHLCGWKGNAWMQYTDSVMSALPVLTSNGFYVSSDGTFTTEPDPEQAKIISDFRIADFWYRRHFLYEELATDRDAK